MYTYYWVAPGWAPQPVPPMMGAEVRRPAALQPRVFTRTLSEGRARQCLPAGEFRYRRGERLEVLQARRVREGLFYLAISPAGCVGWVPAGDLAIRRRGVAGGADGEDALDVEFWDDAGADEGMDQVV